MAYRGRGNLRFDKKNKPLLALQDVGYS